MDINNFRVNPDYRNSFLEEYVGPVDGNSSGRFSWKGLQIIIILLNALLNKELRKA